MDVTMETEAWNTLIGGVAVYLDEHWNPVRISDGGRDLDEAEVQQLIETALRCWIDVNSMSWSGAAGEHDWTADCSLSEDQPTHLIRQRDAAGKVAEEYLVRLFPDETGGGPAFTHDELEQCCTADWELHEDGYWCFQGLLSPRLASGTIEVEELRPFTERMG